MPATDRRADATPSDEDVVPPLDKALVLRLAEERGWNSADAIAAALGVDRSTYYRLLKRGNPQHRTARRMSNRAGVPMDVLFPAQQQAAA